jgi:hypothetical protein
VRVTVATLVSSTSYCVDDPRARLQPWSEWYGFAGPVNDFGFRLQAFHGDDALDIPVQQRADDRAYWDGSIVFPAAGAWVIRMVYPQWSGGGAAGEACAGARINVLVRGSDGLPEPGTATSSTAAATPEVSTALLAA